jgi:recombination protein RecA
MAAKTEQKTSEDKVTAARNKNLDLAIQQIAKDYGEGAIMRLGDEKIVDIDVIPTGNILIDRALGVGGFPRGRVVEVFGPESSGKTTLTLTVIAQAQKRGGLAAFIDVEHALDPAYAKRLGVDLDDLLVSQPSSGEEALRICETLVRSNALDVIVLDSVAALVTRAELEGEIGDTTVGAQARLMSAAILCQCSCRHSSDRRDQADGRRCYRKSDPHKNREEQGRASLHGSGVRHHV